MAILIGLTLAGGWVNFFPASHMATLSAFLAAIFAIAISRVSETAEYIQFNDRSSAYAT